MQSISKWTSANRLETSINLLDRLLDKHRAQLDDAMAGNNTADVEQLVAEIKLLADEIDRLMRARH